MQKKMNGKKTEPKMTCKGVITVFFTLLSIVFLGVSFALVESVRVSGARAQAENIVDMGSYSVFGEFEKRLLEKYEIFAVDGAYGSGDFSIQNLNEHLKTYLDLNAAPHTEGLSLLCFDPWKLSVSDCEITEYALLTDDNSENFYQQAVAYIHETALAGMTEELLAHFTDAGEIKQLEEQYNTDRQASEQNMESASAQEAQRRKELKEQEKETGKSLVPMVLPENPLPALTRVIRRGILRNVCGDTNISDGRVSGSDLCSTRSHKKGNMKLTKKYGGLTDNLLFREYLLTVFSAYTDKNPVGKLKYQLEYIIAGKRSDTANLKSIATRLLLLREGANYAYCMSDPSMRGMTAQLAGLLLGWTGMPVLIEILDNALLLGWAYGESLVDVRTLLCGKRVPLKKDPGSWYVTLGRLGQLEGILDAGGSPGTYGLNYKEYLRILLNLQSVTTQKKRGLDMLELHMKEEAGLSSFQADYCIVGAKSTVEWEIPILFSAVTQTFLPVWTDSWSTTVKGSFAYD